MYNTKSERRSDNAATTDEFGHRVPMPGEMGEDVQEAPRSPVEEQMDERLLSFYNER